MVEGLNRNLIILEKAKTKLNNTIQLLTNLSPFQPINHSTVLIIGVFHGDEPQGKYLIEKYLFQEIYPPLDGNNNLIFIPCLNPDGMQNNTRINANSVDLNRNFPTKNWGQDGSDAGENPKDYYGGKAPASADGGGGDRLQAGPQRQPPLPPQGGHPPGVPDRHRPGGPVRLALSQRGQRPAQHPV